MAASTSAALEPVEPRSRPSTAGAVSSPAAGARGASSRRTTEPGPRRAGSSRPMRLRTGRTSSRGSAGKPRWAGRAGCASRRARPRPVGADAAKRSAPSASKTPACCGDLDRRVAERGHAGGDGSDEGPVPDEHHGAVDLALVVQAVDVAGDALEEPAEDAAVRLALVGEVGELALGEHGAAAGDGDAVRAGLGQLDGLVERAARAGRTGPPPSRRCRPSSAHWPRSGRTRRRRA